MEVAVLTWPFLSGQLAPVRLTGGQTLVLLGGPGLPKLTPSGQRLLKRCEDRLKEMSTQRVHQRRTGEVAKDSRESAKAESGAEIGVGAWTGARGRVLTEGMAKTWFRWNVSRLPPSAYHSDFGWVESLGMGTHQARVGIRTCVTLAVMTRDGHMFDRGCLQRAAFMANMSSVEAEEGLTGRKDKAIR